MNLEDLKKDPRTLQLKEEYERKRRKSLNLDFFELLERFANPAIRMTKIAEEAGTSHKQLSWAYDRWFRPLLDDKSVHERRRADTLERQEKKAAERMSPLLRLVEHQARAAGHKVGHLGSESLTNRSYTRRKTLLINGHQCQVRTSTRPFVDPATLMEYARLDLSHGESRSEGFIIFALCFPRREIRLLVIPAQDVPEGRTFYVPLRHDSTKEGWWKYENAWHLITPQP